MNDLNLYKAFTNKQTKQNKTLSKDMVIMPRGEANLHWIKIIFSSGQYKDCVSKVYT